MHELEEVTVLACRLVCSMKAREDVLDDGARNGKWDGVATLADELHERREGSAVDVLENEKRLALHRNHIERRDDIRVAKGSRKARLVEKHLRESGIGREVSVQPLDRDGAR